MVDKQILQRLLNNLGGYLNDLRSASDITRETYLNDIRAQRFVERTLQIAIECCLDVIHHIISDEGFREPNSYADGFKVLAENGVLPNDAVENYRLMTQFRNRLVHYYEKIDPEQVFAIFRGKLDTFDTFKAEIEGWLARGEA